MILCLLKLLIFAHILAQVVEVHHIYGCLHDYMYQVLHINKINSDILRGTFCFFFLMITPRTIISVTDMVMAQADMGNDIVANLLLSATDELIHIIIIVYNYIYTNQYFFLS